MEAVKKLFALIQWEDNFTNVINLEAVKCPRKDISEYVEGEYISAMYGNQLYRAVIAEIGENRPDLVLKSKKGLLKHTYTTQLDGKSDAPLTQSAPSTTVPDDPTRIPPAPSTSSAAGPSRTPPAPSTTVPTSSSRTQPTPSTSVPTSTGSPSRTLPAPITTVPAGPSRTQSAPSILTVSTTLSEAVPSMSLPPLTTLPTSALRNSSTTSDSCSPQENEILDSASSSSTLSTSPSSHSRDDTERKLMKRLRDLEHEVSSLRKRIKKLEKGAEVKEDATPTATDTNDSTTQEQRVESLLKGVAHMTPKSEREVTDCIRMISMEIFNHEELMSCSRTGKKNIKSGENPKPPLSYEKLALVERAVLTKCPHLNAAAFKVKFDNLLKVERRKAVRQKQV